MSCHCLLLITSFCIPLRLVVVDISLDSVSNHVIFLYTILKVVFILVQLYNILYVIILIKLSL